MSKARLPALMVWKSSFEREPELLREACAGGPVSLVV
jgi:hypothetical protein